ncbi:MAG: ribonuclease HI [Corallococcus sp.]|nr:ribonuclease HI [Corallococcus sp.]MCM1359162.1 ribonuclease HI [Corallococcus sp.]MCM1394552.1 ribonuclease HI [Corallococcus sp.]
MKSKVTIYTDGACSGNPGAGGWAAVLTYNGKIKEISGFEPQTTNNRMELRAVIEALCAVKQGFDCDVFSDSAYVVNAVNNNWITSWKLRGWKTSDNKQVKNVDLWEQLTQELARHKVSFIKVKGHALIELNERCDLLARQQIEQNFT